jgi:hypothetical protein
MEALEGYLFTNGLSISNGGKCVNLLGGLDGKVDEIPWENALT